MFFIRRSAKFYLFLFFTASCLSTQAVYEEPSYIVLHHFEDIEVRKYKSSIVAEVTVKGTREESSYKGFRVLADFISGANVSKNQSVKIQMTRPVLQTKQKNKWRVSFFMPDQWTLQSLPQPKDKNISIKKMNQRIVAAIRFSGRWTDKNFNQHEKKLLDYLAKNKYKRIKGPLFAYYNSPFVPWFMRRNEVMYIISK